MFLTAENLTAFRLWGHSVSPFLSGLRLGLQWKRAAWTRQQWQPVNPLQNRSFARHLRPAGTFTVGLRVLIFKSSVANKTVLKTVFLAG